ncbi:MAG: hypothetical protein A3I11_04620 [Elusimicrobia bacterium RIFCSPLOWO2_02_FULL_39_32]|nr:MAG: hypothetical protein A2034_04920 [Elusimicrobia bacterium GWA2_38_7]OGR79648.1 MAG: hypothetical protein A3B80_03190 [Elusimicrobia bacterium RIFCSPHIGHO2_02_FULL_39_36]OGR92975.1 MAG: hypothetical protein A3I11_04620 [Elusimicrobia bacterium RIFCSPLOWO2_02_FULL_39_32]OGR99758.1 MAG: hypothetical protein A3G85_01980 [Elusimicrobia bacterium RIFCSPLOWO2_12_FULL_39_28]
MKPKILFVCIGNSCRSQMAEGFAKALAEEKIEAYSAGSRPLGYIHPRTIQVMHEVGIDISQHSSKSLYEVPQIHYDIVVGMGCGDACPQIKTTERLDWEIPDPFSGGAEDFKKVRDQIKKQVLELLKEKKFI